MYLKEFDSLEILTFNNSKSEFRMHFHDTYVISLIEKGTFIENNFIGVSGNILISHPFEIHENKIFDDYNWELNPTSNLKEKLTTYNIEDCKALIKVQEWLISLSENNDKTVLANTLNPNL